MTAIRAVNLRRLVLFCCALILQCCRGICHRVGKVHSDFIAACMGHLRTAVSLTDHQRTQRCLSLLQHLLHATRRPAGAKCWPQV